MKVRKGLLLLSVVLGVSMTACGGRQEQKEISSVQREDNKWKSSDMQENHSTQENDEEKEFDILLGEINSKKRGLNASKEALDRYRYDYSNDKPKLTKEDVSIMKNYNKKKVKKHLPVADAKKEVSWLFRLLRSQYGLYTYYGGDAVFEKQERAIRRKLGTKGTVAVKDYEKILHEHLDFIIDNHLTIGDSDFSADITLFSNEETHYIKSNGAFSREDNPNDAIRSINGKAPECYLKRAINEAGRLTYYPYAMEKTKESYQCGILYESGKEENIVLRPAKYAGDEMVDRLYDFKQYDDLGYIALNVMMFEDEDEYMTEEYHRFLEDVPKMKAQKNLVFDLRRNGGGDMVFVEKWFSAFTGERPQPNYSTLRIRPIMMGGLKEMDKLAVQWGMEKSGKYYYCQYPEGQYLENKERRIFVLTSRRTASSAEGFVDLANNMENVVTIGTNTGGVFTNMANYSVAMPYSRLYLEFGECLMYYEPAYFRESYGMEPDIYLTGENLEDRLEKFFEIYVWERGAGRKVFK